ncbi:YitT family protein [Brooklawnia cerclae]|uniref:Uncharacterized membrane-anchored protein YitT (DUF2179 family) n=1 Tax=Brooklawnia cerclae TaxID=349934 RepID=A0ABX0SFK9_9ACTN|nr:YitT family protein [Brooklawnia cerclae]NIH57183.1 uncharacterized membrane-anchored protein YitT (DUF2179 family) [Brooklawnia cerclae]
MTQQPSATKHSGIEDVLGLTTGVVMVSAGLFLLRSGGVVSGGTAGLSLLLSYALPVPFGVLFVAVNLPFFVLAAFGKGWSFTIRSGLSIGAVALLTSVHGQPWALGALQPSPLYAAGMGNVLSGVGLLILFRHKSSLGGFNIVALILQERFGFRAGYVLMVLDTLVVVSSLTVSSPLTVVISAGGAAILNVILALNHRPGRYTGS